MDRFKSKVVILSFAVLILVLVALLILFLAKPNISKQTVSKDTSVVATSKENIRKDIKVAFPDPKDKGISAYVDLAFAEKKPLQSYLYINKAFDKMAVSYKNNRTPEKLITMINLRSYAKPLPNYKESDFVIPK